MKDMEEEEFGDINPAFHARKKQAEQKIDEFAQKANATNINLSGKFHKLLTMKMENKFETLHFSGGLLFLHSFKARSSA